MNAPPKALRRITVTLGTVASANACTSFAPWRITPSRSWRDPGQEARRVDEHEQRQRRRSCRCARSARPSARTSASSTPPRCLGWLAMIPIERPSRRANAQTTLRDAPRRDLHQPPAVDQRARHVADVVDLARLRGHGARPARSSGAATAGHICGATPCVLGQVVEQVARQQRRVDVGGRREVADAVSLVHARAAERGGVHLLAGHLRDDRRARSGTSRAPALMITKSLSAGP